MTVERAEQIEAAIKTMVRQFMADGEPLEAFDIIIGCQLAQADVLISAIRAHPEQKLSYVSLYKKLLWQQADLMSEYIDSALDEIKKGLH